MGVFQRIGNAMVRFMYGRNGMDQLNRALIFLYLGLCVDVYKRQPLAISKLTSEAYTQGRENEKRKIFRTAIWLFFALGLVGSLLMFFQADLLVGFLRNENAMRPVQALAPAVFCVCILACMRGYTQGQGNICLLYTSTGNTSREARAPARRAVMSGSAASWKTRTAPMPRTISTR